ncbi:MAG: hypothetical protein GYA33_07220, partial [Thermogutta sp.]|nr:hypothetical protein [Thermogutta sp.]
MTPVTDLYSLAATYVKLRTGNEPFGDNPGEIFDRQRRGDPILDGLEAGEKPLLLAALDPDPGKRPSDGARNWVRRLHQARLSGGRQPKAPAGSTASPPGAAPQWGGSGHGRSEVAGTIPPGTFVAIQPPGRCSFSPDGRRIVTASGDKTAGVWDAQTGERLLVLGGHTGLVWSAAFSPDARRIVTASADKTAGVWDAQTGERLLVLQGHTECVNSAGFSPGGRRIVTASSDNTAIIW